MTSSPDNQVESWARWSLRLLGGFDLATLPRGERVALPRKRERVLLAYLALSPNCRTSRRKLATLLWGDASDETALDNLRTGIWSLRKALGDEEHHVIASEGDDIVLDAAALDVDVVAFRCLAAQSGLSELEAAANLYTGELLDGIALDSEEFESWRRLEATALRDSATQVLLRLLKQQTESGNNEKAIAAGSRLLQLDPLHEPAARQLMRLYAADGRRSAAIQIYRTLTDTLERELDAQPEPETRAVYAQIARGGDERRAVAQSVPPHGAPAAVMAPPMRTGATTAERLRRTMRMRPLAAIAAGILIFATVIAAGRQWLVFRDPSPLVAERALPASQASPISIAVLPFLNLSGDPKDEYFADGMTEEITSVLSKIPSLPVVGRTSAFQFKGKSADLTTIGRVLHAAYLIEGSVRKAGDRVRITAQLIRASDGVHVWSDSYDRTVSDIFAVQENIARAIAASLQLPLGLKQGEPLISNRAVNPADYQLYLLAKAIVRQRGPTSAPLTQAAQILEQIVGRNPTYAPAWALLGLTDELIPGFSGGAAADTAELRHLTQTWFPRAEAAARTAVRLDSGNADAYVALATVQEFSGKFSEATASFQRALALDPANPEALQVYSTLLQILGYVRDALPLRLRLQALEPSVPPYNAFTGLNLWLNGETMRAVAIGDVMTPGSWYRGNFLPQVYAAQGRYREAADLIAKTAPGIYPAGVVETAAGLLRTAPARAQSAESLPRLGLLSWVYLFVGAPQRALEPAESAIEAGFFGSIWAVPYYHPSAAVLRKSERFKNYVRRAGYVAYWKAHGWPEFCHPTTGDDFACN